MDNLKPIHLAVLVPGCAATAPDGVAVSGRVGPLVESLAELVGETTIIGYDPPASPRLEDRTDYVVRSSRAKVTHLSLGPKGTMRNYLSRRRTVAKAIRAQRDEWDVLFLPLVNRRVGLVFSHVKEKRIFAQIGGHTPSVVKSGPKRDLKHYLQLVAATIVERTYRAIARRSLFFVNGEALAQFYEHPAAHIELARDAARRAEHSFVAADRLTSPAPNLLIIGRMTAGKGVIETLDAFAAVRATTMPGATLHVVGTGDADETMKAHARAIGVNDAVVWHGWVATGPDLFRIYEDMDVMLLLSHAESLPKTVWEAMAHSVLVISTPVGAMPDVYKDEEDLLFVPVNDADAAAAAINRLAEDPALRRRLIARGLATSADASADAFAEHMLDRVTAKWPELCR